ncbi:MAG: cytochrome c [Cyclobacteriaceae bacterium]
MKMRLNYLYIGLFTLVLAACTAGPNDTGVEFSPQMYHSTPYEPLSQIDDKEISGWLSSTEEEGHAEFYNSNPYNKHGMTMREPVPGTVRRGAYLIPSIDAADYETAAVLLTNPTDSSAAVIKDGKALYESYCIHCHGKDGNGDGKVGQAFKGVPSYSSAAIVDKPGGHIYHVITNGKGRMGSHASQISPVERWKIVRYVQVLQNK